MICVRMGTPSLGPEVTATEGARKPPDLVTIGPGRATKGDPGPTSQGEDQGPRLAARTRVHTIGRGAEAGLRHPRLAAPSPPLPILARDSPARGIGYRDLRCFWSGCCPDHEANHGAKLAPRDPAVVCRGGQARPLLPRRERGRERGGIRR